MPNPKSGTITFDLERAIREVKAGRVEFKVDKGGDRSTCPSARPASSADQLVANLAALVDAVNRARPTGAKGQYLKGADHREHDGPRHQGRHPGTLLAVADRAPR